MSLKKQLMTIAGILLVGAVVNSAVILYQIGQMRSDARVLNQAGIVRGATQRVIKRELQSENSDQEINRIDELVVALSAGSSTLGLPPATDSEFAAAMQQVSQAWDELKKFTIRARTDDTLKEELYQQSEEMFECTDAAVFAMQKVAEGKVATTQFLQIMLFLLNLVIVCAIIYITRKAAMTLNETIGTLAATVAQMAATSEMQQRIASDQATATNQTTTTIEELGETSRMAARQSESTAEESRQSTAMAQQGAETVQHTLNAMGKLKDNVSGLSQEILALSERINQIGEISAFVGDLANQTNMLALNASVEAAHAGEHGKGFAVVASEIRKLADQSTKSVSRINTLVSDIQQATNSAVMSTEEGKKVVEHGMTLAGETAEVFNNLDASINRAAESIQQISLNNREQSSGIDQVVEAIESLNDGARASANGLKQTNEALQTLNGALRSLQAMVGIADGHPR